MTDNKYAEFDISKLFAAMKAKRESECISERQMMDELNAANNQVIPMSLETVRGMLKRNSTTCQHALHMCRWLDRTPECFLAGVEKQEPLPFSSRGRLYWNMPALARAVATQKENQGITWKQLAQELNCSQNQVSGLNRITYGISIHLAMRITQWLQRPSVEFIMVI